jgi:hypothetical protein
VTILTGRNLPKIRQPREPEPSIINEKRSQTSRAWLSKRVARSRGLEKYRRFDRGERMPPDWIPPQRAAGG